MPDAEFFEQIKLFLPKYLTPEESSDLFSELAKFPDNMSFYLSNVELQNQLLQGDGWRGFVVVDFLTGNRKTASGVIVSNSCDVDLANIRDVPVNVLFSPLIELSRYRERLN